MSSDLQRARIFSTRNGFGPIPIYCHEERKAAELHSLLTSSTYAEEEARYQITPLVHLAKYSMVTIGCI
eukprot:7374178-Ditylum_brightwellii.AAC.1